MRRKILSIIIAPLIVFYSVNALSSEKDGDSPKKNSSVAQNHSSGLVDFDGYSVLNAANGLSNVVAVLQEIHGQRPQASCSISTTPLDRMDYLRQFLTEDEIQELALNSDKIQKASDRIARLYTARDQAAPQAFIEVLYFEFTAMRESLQKQLKEVQNRIKEQGAELEKLLPNLEATYAPSIQEIQATLAEEPGAYGLDPRLRVSGGSYLYSDETQPTAQPTDEELLAIRGHVASAAIHLEKDKLALQIIEPHSDYLGARLATTKSSDSDLDPARSRLGSSGIQYDRVDKVADTLGNEGATQRLLAMMAGSDDPDDFIINTLAPVEVLLDPPPVLAEFEGKSIEDLVGDSRFLKLVLKDQEAIKRAENDKVISTDDLLNSGKGLIPSHGEGESKPIDLDLDFFQALSHLKEKIDEDPLMLKARERDEERIKVGRPAKELTSLLSSAPALEERLASIDLFLQKLARCRSLSTADQSFIADASVKHVFEDHFLEATTLYEDANFAVLLGEALYMKGRLGPNKPDSNVLKTWNPAAAPATNR